MKFKLLDYYISERKFFKIIEHYRFAFYTGLQALILALFAITTLNFANKLEALFLFVLYFFCLILLNRTDKYFRKKNALLSTYTLKEITPNSFRDTFALQGFDLYLELISVKVLLVVSTVLILVPFITYWYQDVLASSDYIFSMWQVHATVVSITFVVTIFLLEFAKDSQDIGAETYNKVTAKSGFKIITVINVLSILIIGITAPHISKDSNSFWLILVMFLFSFGLLSTIYLFLQLIRFLDPFKRNKIFNKILLNRLQLQFLTEIYNRVVQNVFYSLAKSENILVFGSDLYDQYSPIELSLNKQQIISDINMDTLRGVNKITSKTLTSNGEKLVFIKQIGYPLDKGNNLIARFSASEEETNAKIVKMVQKSLVLSNSHKQTELEIDSYIDSLRDRAVSALQVSDRRSFRDLVKTYLKIHEVLILILERLNIQRSYRDVNEAFFDIRSAILLESSIRSLINATAQSNDVDLIKDLLFFPYQLMEIGWDKREAYPLVKGLAYYEHWYYATNLAKVEIEARNFVTDRVTAHLSEFVMLNIYKKFIRDVIDEDELSLKTIDNIQVTYNNLSKAAIDRGNFSDFKKFRDSHKKFLGEIQRTTRIHSNSRDNTQEDFRKIDHFNSTKEDEFYIISFGLGAWSFKAQGAGSFNGSNLAEFIDYCKLQFLDVKKLIKLYLQVDRRSIGNKFGWEWWEMRERGEGSHWVNNDWLPNYFVFVLDSLLENVDVSEFTVNLDQEEKSYFGSTGIKKIKEDIDASYDRLVSNGFTLLHKDKALAIFTALEVSLHQEEQQVVISSDLNEALVAAFKTNVIDSWIEHAVVRKILHSANAYRDLTNTVRVGRPPRLLQTRGFIRKELFLEHTASSYGNFDKEYGRTMATTENIYLTRKLHSASRKETVPIDGAKAKIDTLISIMRSNGYSPDILILNDVDTYKLFRNDDKYSHNWDRSGDRSTSHIYGYYDGIPVVHIYTHQNNSFVVLADIGRFAKLTQHGVSNSCREELCVSVENCDDDFIDSYLDAHPEYVERNSQFTREQLRDDMARRAYMEISERPVLEITDKDAGIVIELEDADD